MGASLPPRARMLFRQSAPAPYKTARSLRAGAGQQDWDDKSGSGANRAQVQEQRNSRAGSGLQATCSERGGQADARHQGAATPSSALRGGGPHPGRVRSRERSSPPLWAEEETLREVQRTVDAAM